MATRSEREKAQKLNEQHQAILSKMLREEDNKYCADCEAKGPRWASWNLGVFMCIRCAGIHRNLGVHISRVKSVNLDQWTPEQIQSVQDMGNTRARRLYEATLPDNFRRPQTDQAVEFFIRDKYERKKYYDKNAINGGLKSNDAALPSASSPSSHQAEKSKLEKEREKKEEKKKERESERGTKPSSLEKPQKRDEPQPEPRPSPMKHAEPAIDLLGLDAPAAAAAHGGSGSAASATLSDDLDIFGPMVSNPLPPSNTQFSQASSSKATGAPAAGAGSSAPAQGDLDLFTESGSGKAEDSAKKLLSKDSILSLYSTSSLPPQPAPAAMFMGPSQMQFPSQPGQGYQGFAPPTTMMGTVLGQSGPAMGQSMMVGMTMPNGFMGAAQAGVMGLAPGGVMGAQGGGVPPGVVPPQNMYAMQPGQQQQWNISQMNQHMSGLNVNGAGGALGLGQPGPGVGGWVAPPSGQTLSTQLWK
ncbi:stromal membrane-associated protein 1 isoform X1 [Conger conger]|uniref:stromal membrane-associated protein 1 isoform X1 n=1 Tax=Conger conger TaxID=82655 RepID=UPI002A5A3883|nr:stromal membrane-associated protein 1 isoform X1 [Conger conger]